MEQTSKNRNVERVRKVGSFTIIELIMVIVIIGILAFSAIPRFKVHYQIKVEGAAKKISSDINFVQDSAISQHVDTRIVFDVTADTYQAEYYDTDSSSWKFLKNPFTRMNLVLDFRTDYQYAGIDIASVDFNGSNTLRFNWRGTPQDSGGNDLSSEGAVGISYKGESIVIKVTPQTGKVTIE